MVQAPCGKRCFQRNYNYGMTEQLAAGSLLPLTGEEIRRGRRDARLAVSSRPCTPGGVGSDTAAQCMSDGSPSVYECGEQADPSAFPCIDEAEKERLRQAFLNPSFQVGYMARVGLRPLVAICMVSMQSSCIRMVCMNVCAAHEHVCFHTCAQNMHMPLLVCGGVCVCVCHCRSLTPSVPWSSASHASGHTARHVTC